MRLKQDIIIAIDGHASCGKSTLAKKLAEELNYSYIDTGAMYRAVTLFAIENNLTHNDEVSIPQLVDNLKNIVIDVQYDNQKGKSVTILNGKNVENEIRNLQVSQYASQVAAIPEIREFLVAQQQEMGRRKRITMDGRDIGIVVFTNAEIKIFLTASPMVRAQRRYKELIEKGEKVSFEEIYNNLQHRDTIDTTRQKDPMHPADDAIIIDNSNMNAQETYILVAALIAERFGEGVHFI